MGIPLLLVATLSAHLLSNIFRTRFSRRKGVCHFDHHFFNSLASLVSAMTVLLLFHSRMTFSGTTVFLGLLFGAVNAIQQITFSQALSIGTLSYTYMIMSMSTVLSALSGAIFWQEKLSVLSIVGLAMMVVCLLLAVKKEEGEKKAVSLRWMLLSLIACLATAAIGILQKTHQESDVKAELYSFLFIAFLFSLFFSLPFFIVGLRSQKREEQEQPFWKGIQPYWGILILCGLFIAANHMINLYLSGVLDSAVMFPVVNGGGLILSTLASLLIFKERLSARQWVGVAFGVAAVAMLCI